MKNIEALNMLGAINAIERDGRKAPHKFSYALIVNRKRLTDVHEAFEKSRQDLLESFGEKDGDGKLKADDKGMVKLTDPVAYGKELQQLHDIDIDVKLHQCSLKDFPYDIEAAFMEALFLMVKDD